MIELLAIATVFGAVLHRSLHIGFVAIVMISALTSAFFFTYFLSKKSLLVGILVGVAIIVGAVRVSFDTEKISQEFFTQKELTGIVQSVDRRLDKTLVIVKENKYRKNIQVTIRSRTDTLPGDSVSVSGQLEQPEDFVTDTGRIFEYQNYLQSKGIVGLVSNGSVYVVTPGGVSLARIAAQLRFHIARIFSRYIQFPADGIASGMLVGYQGSLPQWLSDLFKTTGVLHVLVLSGQNITLLAVFLSTILKPVPFKIRSVLIGLAIVLIVLISGAGVAAVRSGIMGTIALGAGLVRRGYVPLRALTISILFFFFYSPSTLFVDPGFHLSVLATLFMILILPKAQKLCSFLPKKYGIREIVVLAVLMPLCMLPYTMYFSGMVPLSAPVANILLTITGPAIMLLGVFIAALSWIAPIASLLGGILSFFGTSTIAILKVLNTLPQLNTPSLSWQGVVLTYAVFFAIVLRTEIRRHSSSFEQESR